MDLRKAGQEVGVRWGRLLTAAVSNVGGTPTETTGFGGLATTSVTGRIPRVNGGGGWVARCCRWMQLSQSQASCPIDMRLGLTSSGRWQSSACLWFVGGTASGPSAAASARSKTLCRTSPNVPVT